MKKISLFLIPILLLASCTQETIGSIPMDSQAPGVVTDVQVTNVPGGADITFSLPADEDLLYTKALFVRENGEKAEVMTSLYSDKIEIRGFAHSQEQEISLVAGDRSGNESEPVKVKIHPLRSPIFDVLESMTVESIFGGIRLTWTNETKAPISVTLLRQAGTSYEELVTYFSDAPAVKQASRGMEAKPAKFGVFVKDRWDNSTDTVYTALTPYFEEQFPVGTYKKFKMTGDSEIAYGWDLGYALNGDLTEPWGWFSKPTVEGGNWPARFTVQIPGKAKLSRIRIIQRWPEMWENGNPKVFTVWGSNAPAADGSDDGWTRLETFNSIKPSGYGVGQYSDEDEYIAKNGEDFEFQTIPDDYEYYRFTFEENWGGDNTFINLYEVFFFGELKNKSSEE